MKICNRCLVGEETECTGQGCALKKGNCHAMKINQKLCLLTDERLAYRCMHKEEQKVQVFTPSTHDNEWVQMDLFAKTKEDKDW